MRIFILGYFSFILLMFGLSSCKDDQITTSYNIGEEFTIKSNSEIIVHQNVDELSPEETLKLKILNIVDSRCPENVTCIWYGNAEVSFNVEEQSTIYSLCLGQCANGFNETDEIIVSTLKGNYSIKLKSITPFPKAGEENDDKNATIVVNKL